MKKIIYLLMVALYPCSVALAGSEPDTFWTYKTVNGKDLQLSVFLPDDYDEAKTFPTFALN